jgi:hypothetical protein
MVLMLMMTHGHAQWLFDRIAAHVDARVTQGRSVEREIVIVALANRLDE